MSKIEEAREEARQTIIRRIEDFLTIEYGKYDERRPGTPNLKKLRDYLNGLKR